MLPARIIDTLINFAENTTLRGINRVSTSKHVIGKLLWACIVLTFVALCFRQIYTLGVQYGSKLVNTKIAIRYKKVYFPAVSFCNLNPVSYSKIEEQYLERNGYSIESLLGNELYFEHQKISTEIVKQFGDSTASYGKRKKRTFYTVHLNGKITLECQVIGIPPAFAVQWHKELGDTTMDLTSDNTNKYNGSTPDTPSLTIFNAEQSDHGVYICTARNNYGIAESPRIYLKLTVAK
ncbi:ASIC5 [Mytilus coruscus]|uniref:ASIC5 n=1 Tax=Mytilus coruscus TaxID=42192 RepID=A0A6J8B9E5_MYTCO|nr:ASIC5 [Mytilus coruscus]